MSVDRVSGVCLCVCVCSICDFRFSATVYFWRLIDVRFYAFCLCSGRLFSGWEFRELADAFISYVYGDFGGVVLWFVMSTKLLLSM